MRRCVAVVLLVSIASASLPSFAGEPTATDLATAREAFDEGLALEEKGDWTGALGRFQKVASVRITPQVRFHLGLCFENLGRLVEALNEFRRAESEADGDKTPSAQIVVANAGKHVSDLKARIPRLRLVVPESEKIAAILIDGNAVSESLADRAFFVDAGKHTLTVKTPDGRSFEHAIEFEERSGEHSIDVVFPKPADKPKPTETETSSGRGPWPWLALGVGASAMIGAGVMYKLRSNTLSELDAVCGADRRTCPYDPSSSEARGRNYALAGNILLGVGAATIALGVVLLVIPTSKSNETHVTASIAPNGFVLAGVF